MPETQTPKQDMQERAPEYLRPQPYMEQPALPGLEGQCVIEFVASND